MEVFPDRLRLPLRDCLPESFDFDGLARQKTFVTRVRFFLKEYAKLYHLQKEPDPFGKEALFDAVCELIYQTDGQIRISELSEHTSYTDRYIRKVFQEEMGFPPKTFCNILRFQRAIEFINYGYEEKTADWMTALGYYDQAQCVRDFRKYLGMTPNRYRKLDDSAPPDSERCAFLVVGGQSGFAACPPLEKLTKPSSEQALRPDSISFPRGAE